MFHDLLILGLTSSWDVEGEVQLPPYMRIFYKALLDVYAEMEEDMVNEGESYRLQYAIEEVNLITENTLFYIINLGVVL